MLYYRDMLTLATRVAFFGSLLLPVLSACSSAAVHPAPPDYTGTWAADVRQNVDSATIGPEIVPRAVKLTIGAETSQTKAYPNREDILVHTGPATLEQPLFAPAGTDPEGKPLVAAEAKSLYKGVWNAQVEDEPASGGSKGSIDTYTIELECISAEPTVAGTKLSTGCGVNGIPTKFSLGSCKRTPAGFLECMTCIGGSCSNALSFSKQ